MEFYYLHWAGYRFQRVPKRGAIWLKRGSKQGYRVIMENLFHKLCSKQTDAMGTLRQNKTALPAEIMSTKLKNGEHISVYTERLMIMRCKDKKGICLVSTTHDDKMVPTRV
jgi:hypothetical protein